MDFARRERQVDVDERPNAVEDPRNAGEGDAEEIFRRGDLNSGRQPPEWGHAGDQRADPVSEPLSDKAVNGLLRDVEHPVDRDDALLGSTMALPSARDVGAVLDFLPLPFELRHGDHRIAGVGGVPKESFSYRARLKEGLGLGRNNRAHERQSCPKVAFPQDISGPDRPPCSKRDHTLQIRDTPCKVAHELRARVDVVEPGNLSATKCISG